MVQNTVVWLAQTAGITSHQGAAWQGSGEGSLLGFQTVANAMHGHMISLETEKEKLSGVSSYN